MNKICFRIYISVVLIILISANLAAQIRLPKIIDNNMVLQREKPLPIWGWASAGEKVTVEFAGQKKTTNADDEGYWKVILAPLKTSAKPAEMIISGSNIIKLSNILVGEVWLCSGQSNMEYPLKLNKGYVKPEHGIDSSELELATSQPEIRLFLVEKVLSTPDVTTTGWNDCKGTALEKFSAIGYYFAKNIHQVLNVPIGMISSSWGGSRIEPWTPAEGYTALPAFKNESSKQPLMIDSVSTGKDYRSMIFPLAPFALRGFLWYQGESNCMINDGMRYADKMQALVDSWRKQWASEELPFYSVQIAPYLYTKRKDKIPHTPETLAEFWEAQTQSLKIPRTGMIVVNDLVDHLGDIHPPYKWEVGRRLSLVALAKDYGQKQVTFSGPVFRNMTVKNDKAILSFDYANGLKSRDDKPLNWFEVAGDDGKFLPATASIDGDKVIVSNPSVTKPKDIRFGWNETAQPNLVNNASLLAVPFRTNGIVWNYKKSK